MASLPSRYSGTIQIWTDHKNLTYFQSAQKLNPRQARWATFMSEFHFVLFHKPGITMTKAPALSLTAPTDPGDKTSEITILPPDVFPYDSPQDRNRYRRSRLDTHDED